ncbi:cytochrome P450 [Boeremia exigua]|uniref:cytochrome P450 n=1 Tax=Boeremia exigua TaxID=749465 RepID=UPI001E8EE27E|nr:cytochrome P450 [Boeremia exigua]KAH6633466.1 cytochrome P450 [Boeremia exigua]
MAVLSTLVSPSNFGTQSTTYIAITAAVLLFVYRIFKYLTQTHADIPLVFPELDAKARAQKWFSECDKVVQAGHRLFQEKQISMFRATVEDGTETVVVSDRYINELKALPDSVLSVTVGVNEDMLSQYSHIKVVDPIGQHAIRSDLTPRLPLLMPAIAEEAVVALDNFFPKDADDWVSISVFQVVLNSVAQVSARLFVGTRLCRDPRWLQCSQTAAISAFATVSAMKRWSAWLRPLAQYLEPEKRALEAARTEAIAILKEDAEASQSMDIKDEDKDYLSYWVSNRHPKYATDFGAQALLQLELSIAAIHTTTMAVTHMVYDLATYPEYVRVLRDEIKAALAASGGVYNRDCIAKMVKTESFMKESQRLHPPSFATFKRKVMKSFTLSDGTTFPKGISIQIDASARYRDPQNWENPDQFDGSRFIRLAENDPNKARHQFVSSNADYVFWGQGRHACPGRFFAANEIKTLLAMIVLKYDLSLEPGAERPADIHVGSFINPNPTGTIRVKRV